MLVWVLYDFIISLVIVSKYFTTNKPDEITLSSSTENIQCLAKLLGTLLFLTISCVRFFGWRLKIK